jgi:pepF/M3 family oligoendopeptidase
MSSTTPPRWDLSNVYPGLDSSEFITDLNAVPAQIEQLETYFNEHVSNLTAKSDPQTLTMAIERLLDQFNQLMEHIWTISAYLQSFVTTDSYNQEARKLLSQFEQTDVRADKLSVRVESWIGVIADVLPEIVTNPGVAQAHAFFLQETAEQSKFLMSEVEENLAADLNLSGANAWSKLQGTVTSQLSVDFEIDGNVQKLPMPALINLHSHPDESVRRRAYEAEMAAWETVKEPLAAALNGVKGSVNTLDLRRGRTDALHTSLDSARIDRPTLEAMLDAMHDSFPMFHRYFKAKAARFGKDRLAWWDIFAPAGSNHRTYTFDEARDFILENFRRFSPELSGLAERAFTNHWIDAEQRVGKRGGAFCMSVPAVKESRVLCNFDGTLDQVSTIAHELGHAFHNYCMYKAGKTLLQRRTPMTMAETASIMCETIVVDAALDQAGQRPGKIDHSRNQVNRRRPGHRRYLFPLPLRKRSLRATPQIRAVT